MTVLEYVYLFLTVVAGGFLAGWFVMGTYGGCLAILMLKDQFSKAPPVRAMNMTINMTVIIYAFLCGPPFLA